MKRLIASLVLLFALLGCNVADAAGCTGTGNCYWVGGTGNASSTTNWATTDGGVITGGLPSAADNCNFTSLSNLTAYVFTVDAATTCLSVVVANPATGSPTFAGSSTLAITGSATLVSGMGWTYTGAITFNATATGKTITTAGVTLANNITFNGTGGGWTNQDNLITGPTNTIQLTAGTWSTNAKNITAGIVNVSGATARTWTATNSTITCTGANATVFTSNPSTSLTKTLTGSTITSSGVNATIIAGASFNFITVGFTGGGNMALSPQGITNLSVVGTATMTDNIIVNGNWTATGNMTFGGNSQTNRLTVRSSSLGVQRTLTAATVTLSNTNFSNITGAGAATWSGTSLGDAGGNSNITFATPVNRFWVSNTGNYSDINHWATSSGGTPGATMPLPQDSAFWDVNSITLAGQTVTFDENAVGNLDFTGVLNLPALNLPVEANIYGNMTLNTGVTDAGTAAWSWEHQSGTKTITSNGFIGRTWNQYEIKGPGGTLSLGDDVNTLAIVVTQGTFTANNHNVTLSGPPGLNATGTLTRGLTMGSGTWTFTNLVAGAFWNIGTTTGITFSAGTSTIKLLAATPPAGNRTFLGGGLTYNNFWWAETNGGGAVTVTGSNTFNDFLISKGNFARSLTFSAGATNTVSSIEMDGESDALLTVKSSSGGSAATISDSSGANLWTYLSVQDITASGGATFTACESVNVSGNTGITFGGTGCNGGNNNSLLMLLGVGGWLLERDVNPAANDNTPAYLAKAA